VTAGSSAIRAILFDFGGVVLSSPIAAFRAHEVRANLPAGFIQRLNMTDPDTNAWARMERGELDEDGFYQRFEAEALASGHAMNAREVLSGIGGELRPGMVEVIREAKKRYVVACLTNNMRLGHGTAMSATPEAAAEIAEVMKLFDHVVESAKIGSRKPERRFFEKACEIVAVPPEACVFLDDLGMNLKTARALGMKTIKVTDPAQAIAELESTLGHRLRP